MIKFKNITLILFVFLILFVISNESKAIAYTYKKRNTNKVKIRIDQPITTNFPEMEVFVSVINNNHEPILSLIRGNFKASIDGAEVDSRLDVAGFQYTEEGIAYSLLVAGNGMMEGEPLEEQLKSAIVLMETLRDQDQLSIYVFGEEVNTVFEFQKKNEKLLEKISKIKTLGGNPHLYDALVYAIRRFDETDVKRKVLIVMSDGRESGSRYNKDQMLKVLDEANLPVYSIGMKLMAGQNLYRIAKISQHSGGEYIYSKKLNRISGIMELIARQVLLGYRLSFTVSDIEADNQLHQLHIKTIIKDKEASFFKNFVATKVPLSRLVIIILIVTVVVLLIIFVLIILLLRKKIRREMGITNRKCPQCKRRMKDDWDECLFCKYGEPKKKKRRD